MHYAYIEITAQDGAELIPQHERQHQGIECLVSFTIIDHYKFEANT
jgi:hypothetical protein